MDLNCLIIVLNRLLIVTFFTSESVRVAPLIVNGHDGLTIQSLHQVFQSQLDSYDCSNMIYPNNSRL